MRRMALVLSLALTFVAQTKAQVSVSDSVKMVIQTFFKGMSEADSALVRSTLAPEVVFQSVARLKTTGETTVTTENVTRFLSSISQAKKGQLDERIEFGAVLVEGPLAVVWTPYKFYYEGKLRHCGVNSFQLVRFDTGWKIQYIIDTRRREGCE